MPNQCNHDGPKYFVCIEQRGKKFMGYVLPVRYRDEDVTQKVLRQYLPAFTIHCPDEARGWAEAVHYGLLYCDDVPMRKDGKN